jgi:PAS domain S-box-containing protein
MRGLDWMATPLGPPAEWPRSLKTAVRILLTSRQPFWLGWGPELTYLYNDAYKSIIGGKHPRALGRPFREVWSEILDFVGPMAENVMARDEGSYVEEQLLIMERHGYQEETYYTFSYSPIPDDAGGVGGLICANTEDTGRVIGERQLSLLREVASRTSTARSRDDACRLAVAATSTNARDLPFALLYTRDADDQPLRLAAASEGAEFLGDAARWPLTEALESGEPRIVALEQDERLPCGDWQKPPMAAAVLPIAASGSGVFAGALVVGLNRYRQVDDGYRRFLELVTSGVAAGIANAEAYEQERRRAEALEELDRAKTTFFSNVSHEFRTPLALMLGPVEDLLAKNEASGDIEDRQLLMVMQRSGQRLLKLVNTLLDFARIEAGRAQTSFEPTDLAGYTADLAANFRAACERAGLGLVVDCPSLRDAAWIDRDMWEKVVLNLVSNAFKFTLEGEIGVRVRERAQDFELVVRDTGVGIPAEHLPKLFQRFQRVEGSRGRSHEGSGIGLALVHELVKLHGGHVEVQSEPGHGTTFTVIIPKGHAHLPAAHVKSGAPAAAPGYRAGAFVQEALSWLPGAPVTPSVKARTSYRVLVADDNADLRQYVCRLLATDYEVATAADGLEALAAVRTFRPDVVVSDVMMPRLDGIGLVRALRADPALRTVPVILLSARAGEEARIEGMESGADDYLAKPFSARELLVRVGALIQAEQARSKANDELVRTAAELEALLTAAPLGIFLVDDQFRIAAANPIARPVFGDIPDLVGRDFDEVIHRLWAQEYADEIAMHFHETLATGVPYIVPERVERRRDRGTVEYYEWQIHRIPLPGGRQGVVCYFRDISHIVLAREALRESDRRKDEFIATLSHELRNPLAPIRNSLHILAMNASRDASVSRLHEMMARQVNHLVRLVDDLLEISRINRGTLELKRERVELGAIVRHAIETAEPLIQAAGHELTVELPQEPLWLNGDAVRLGQVLGNVLNNAAKYTEGRGSIHVLARRDGGNVVVGVRDTGIGVPPAEREAIFDMFTRGRQNGNRGGLGVGLALARRLAEMHGGTIEARSEGLGRGSEFVITLPLEVEAEPDRNVTRTVGAALEGRRILVVDDNRDAADSLAMILRILGGDVRVARDGAEALECLREFEAGVVLLDIGMPGMDGYEVARRIRASGRNPRPAIVALTGWGQEQDRARAREAGFDHHLVKPAEIGALNELLSSL